MTFMKLSVSKCVGDLYPKVRQTLGFNWYILENKSEDRKHIQLLLTLFYKCKKKNKK